MATAKQEGTMSGEIPKISSKDITYDETPIGRGGYGYVYRGTHPQLGTVAIKTMITEGLLPARHQRVFRSEAKALWELKHPSVVRLLGLIMEENNYSLVLEYMHFGSLSSFRTDFRVVSWSVIVSIIRDVVHGMDFLHSLVPPILHLDMKSDNILINRKIRAKITDFGLAQWKTMTRTITQSQRSTESVGRNGTVTHVPPEVWNNVNTPPNKAYDIYGFGIVIWEAVTGNRPFGNTSDDIIPKAVLSGQRPDMALIPGDCPPKLSKVMTQCWSQKPDLRPDFSSLKGEMDVLFQSFLNMLPKDLQELEKAIEQLYQPEDIGGDSVEADVTESLYDVATKLQASSNSETSADIEMADVQTTIASSANLNTLTTTSTSQNTSTSNQDTTATTSGTQNVSSSTSRSDSSVISEEQKEIAKRVLKDPIAMLLMQRDPSLCHTLYKIILPTQRLLKSPGIIIKLMEEDPQFKLDLMRKGNEYMCWLFSPLEMKDAIRRKRPHHILKPEIAQKMKNLRLEREKKDEEKIKAQHRSLPSFTMGFHGPDRNKRSFGYRRPPESINDLDDDAQLSLFGQLGYKMVKAFYNSKLKSYVFGENRSSMIVPIDQEVLGVLRNPDRFLMLLEQNPLLREKLMSIDSEVVMKIISHAQIHSRKMYGSSPLREAMMMMSPFDMDEDEEYHMMDFMDDREDLEDRMLFMRRQRTPESMTAMLELLVHGRPSRNKSDLVGERQKHLSKQASSSATTATKSATTASVKTSAIADSKTSTSTTASKSSSAAGKRKTSELKEKQYMKTADDTSKSGTEKKANTKEKNQNEVLKAPVQRQTTTQPLSTVFPPDLAAKEMSTSSQNTDGSEVAAAAVSGSSKNQKKSEKESKGKNKIKLPYHINDSDTDDDLDNHDDDDDYDNDDDSDLYFKLDDNVNTKEPETRNSGSHGAEASGNAADVTETGNSNSIVVSVGKRGSNRESFTDSKKIKKNGTNSKCDKSQDKDEKSDKNK